MNKIFPHRMIAAVLISFSVMNCASYWKNRKNDLQDIITIGVEKPGYGAGLRIGPVAAGFIFQGGSDRNLNKGIGYGLRGGHLGKYHSRQMTFGILGGEMFFGGDAPEEEPATAKKEETLPELENERDNIKSHYVRYLSLYNDPPKERRKRRKEAIQRIFIEDLVAKTGENKLKNLLPDENKKPFGYPASYLFQVDVYVAVHYGLRAGVNFAELLDFILGFTGWDILGDDME